MSCTQTNRLLITIDSSPLYVRGINYSAQHLRVYDEAFQGVVETCSVPDKNITILDPRFAIVGNHSWVVMYSECNLTSSSTALYLYFSNCENPIFVMSSNDPESAYASKMCKSNVRLPAEVYDGELIVYYDDLKSKGAVVNWNQYRTVLNRGFEVSWRNLSCGRCVKSGGLCGVKDGYGDVKCFCRDGAHPLTCPPRIPLASIAVLTVIIVGLLLLKRKKRQITPRNITDFLKKNESLTPKRFKYSEIKKMTRSFKDKLGQGGFGSVYKGELEDGRLVAVKVLSSANSSGGEDFINEVASISSTSHVSIVTLVGFCINRCKRALVYHFMANGSLEKFIYQEKLSGPKRLLGWDKLHSIAVGIAQGLEYLHRGCNTRILHLDIKPHNILLDEEFCPKISDFGLAKVCKHKESAVSIMGARGTVGFIAPEQVCRNLGQVSHKSDVYSYGMMVLEMVGGRTNVDAVANNPSEIYFPHWIYKRIELNQELGLNGVTDEDSEVKARKMVIVGLWCIQTDPASRPPISQVVDMLQGSIELLPVPPRPYMYSPSSSPKHSSAIFASSTLC